MIETGKTTAVKIRYLHKRCLAFFSSLGPCGSSIFFMATGLALLSLFRLLLSMVYFDRIVEEPRFLLLFPVGLRMDTLILCYFIAPVTLLSCLLPQTILLHLKKPIQAYFTGLMVFIVFMEIATFPFVEEFDLRPDRVFIEYLIYPKEVFGMLWTEYKLNFLISSVAIVLTAWFSASSVGQVIQNQKDWTWKIRLLTFPLIGGLVFLGARSSVGHRAANISTASITNNHLVNEFALNSSYSVLYALYRIKHEDNPGKLYGKLSKEEVVNQVRRTTLIPETDFVGPANTFVHRQKSKHHGSRPLNVVIILEESLGAEFVGALGGLPLTPNLDALSKEGMLLTQLYATGTRTARGIEAVVSGFLPTPGESIVKLPQSRRDFFTAGMLLAAHGYATEFIYGGMSNFDEMRSFFLGNGFQRVYDQPTFKNPDFAGIWGVSDEDLFKKSHELFLEHGDEPFFALLLTTSNHSPFEYPDGHIEHYDQPAATRLNAMKYADYALGELFRLAKTAPYYKNTLFLVVADHNTRVRGKDLVPIDKFHIPGLIIGPNVEPMAYDKIASQIDLLPTLLDLAGLDTTHPMIGRNLLEVGEVVPGRAFMQYSKQFAYRVEDQVVILRPEEEPKQFQYIDNELIPATLEPEMAKDALAHSLLPWILYSEKTYRLPPQE